MLVPVRVITPSPRVLDRLRASQLQPHRSAPSFPQCHVIRNSVGTNILLKKKSHAMKDSYEAGNPKTENGCCLPISLHHQPVGRCWNVLLTKKSALQVVFRLYLGQVTAKVSNHSGNELASPGSTSWSFFFGS